MSEIKRVINVIPLTRVNLRSSQIFTYLVPLKLHDQLRPGQIVKIPFGQRRISGVVSSLEMHRLGSETKKFKYLENLVDPFPQLTEKQLQLADWLSNYYVSSLGLVLKAMLPKLVKKAKAPYLVGQEKYNPDFLLNEYQHRAVTQIVNKLGQAQTFLLYGVSGSGKTEVYMQIIERVLACQKQVIILVPEISLTRTAIERFSRRFGIENIAVLHSRLRPTERFWTWEKIRNQEKQIIIGPRSAIFSPVQNLGLIVIDEEHDPSYKQSDQNPKYRAVTVAKKLSQLWQCPLVLGDAIPSVESYHEALGGNSVLLNLPYKVKADVGLPKVILVDMRNEIKAGNYSIFSEVLQLSILENLRAKKQTILFLNRRGAANFVICRDCGYIPMCSECSTSLVWHSAGGKLICHHCGRSYQLEILCPVCKGTRLKYCGIGTQLVEEQLKEFLNREFRPGDLPCIARVDSDSPIPGSEENQTYRDWAAGRIQILVGTQLISKGWDISQAGLVGIILADRLLSLPDFRSNERAFQILTQMAEDLGGGQESKSVILQTYRPENLAIDAVKMHDYEKFFRKEILERKKFHYPPYSQLAKLTFKHRRLEEVKKNSQRVFRQMLARRETMIEIIGPAPAFVEKVRGKYRYQIILKLSKNTELDLHDLFQDLPSTIDIDIDPESLL